MPESLLRVLACGSVDDGKSTLIGRLLHDARGQGANDFKIPLARRTLIATLRDLTGGI